MCLLTHDNERTYYIQRITSRNVYLLTIIHGVLRIRNIFATIIVGIIEYILNVLFSFYKHSVLIWVTIWKGFPSMSLKAFSAINGTQNPPTLTLCMYIIRQRRI